MKLRIACSFFFAFTLLLGCGRPVARGPTDGTTATEPADANADTTITLPDDAPLMDRDTPEACFEAMVTALKDQDWKQYLASLSSVTQKQLVGELAWQLTRVTDLDGRKRVTELFKKHDLADIDVMGLMQMNDMPGRHGVEYAWRIVGGRVQDKSAFFKEAYAILGKRVDATEMLDKVKLTDVKINGKTAVGTVQSPAGSGPINFLRIDGQWVIEIANPDIPDPPTFSPQEREAITALQKDYIGSIRFAAEERGGKPEGFHFISSVGDEELEPIQHLPSLKRVSLDRSRVSDAGLRFLKPLKQLEFLPSKRSISATFQHN